MDGSSSSVPTMKGWLMVEEVDGDWSVVSGDGAQRRWVVLSNGVLWIRRFPDDLTYEGSLPLMNTVLEWPPGARVLTVRMRGSDREFRLQIPRDEKAAESAEEEEEALASWEKAMGESKKMWAEKRRASALFRHSQAVPSQQNKKKAAETQPAEKTVTENKPVEKVPTMPPLKNRSLREIVMSSSYGPSGHRELPPWETLPEVTSMGLPESLEETTINVAKITFQLAASEAEYNEELNNLCQLGKRIVVQWTNDPSPLFLRRAVFSDIQRMKSQSDSILAKLESLWEKRPTLTGSHGFFAQAIPEMRTPYMSYSGHIEEIRLIIQRALEVHPDALWAASTGNGKRELVLAPLQRLTSLRIMLQASTAADTPLKYEEKGDAKRAIEGVKELLDECYAEMTTQSGTQYVAEIDNLLDFTELATSKSPLLLLLAACEAGSDSSDDEGKESKQPVGKKRIECLASRPSIFWNESASIAE
ncbi:uncharacterized protein LOC124159121 [Ischnura elegans]|uniref:uncharacterized protein LOC124159121 n=1 Tax=Ischnura elegans TaxID=197161 RepID=UPI001ED895FF|nr:uncharacterized protein LOC124159121 [Ischnura elegans]